MLQIFRSKIDTIFQIVIAFAAISISSLFEDKIIYAAISVFILVTVLIFYDICKYWIAGKVIVSELDWIYCVSKHFWVRSLIDSEGHVGRDSIIIIVTDTLDLDATDKSIINVVKRNLDRGVEYVIVTSDDQINSDNFAALQILHAKNPNFSISSVKREIIERRTFDNLMVISNSSSGLAEAYLQLPVGKEEWWAKMDEQHAKQAYRNVKLLLSENSLNNCHGFDPREKYSTTLLSKTN